LIEQEFAASIVDAFWFNPAYQCFTNKRTVKIAHYGKSEELLEEFKHLQGARIYNILSHEPIITQATKDCIAKGLSLSHFIQRVKVKDIDGDDYIDEFGYYLYSHSFLGFEPDLDLRYELSTEPERELFHLQQIYHDLLDRELPNVTVIS
jgi:hypothetical protein